MPNIYPNSQPQPYYGVNGKLTDDAKALPVPKKVFILDKSVLLYSPYAVFAFDEHTVTIPFNVIRDLDAIKKSQGESSRNAQEALSIIETLREKGNLRCGVPLENGGMFFVDDSSNEYGRAIVSDSVGLEEGRTTLGKVKKHKVFYRKNEDGSVTKYTLDTTNITNDVHKWLADRGYSKVG